MLSDECVSVWRGRLGSGWGKAFYDFSRFHEEVLSKHEFFAGFSPSRLVEWQLNANGRDRFKILRLAQNWTNEKDWRYSSKQVVLSHIRSFFLHNQASLPADRSFRFKSDIPPC